LRPAGGLAPAPTLVRSSDATVVTTRVALAHGGVAARLGPGTTPHAATAHQSATHREWPWTAIVAVCRLADTAELYRAADRIVQRASVSLVAAHLALLLGCRWGGRRNRRRCGWQRWRRAAFGGFTTPARARTHWRSGYAALIRAHLEPDVTVFAPSWAPAVAHNPCDVTMAANRPVVRD
jgi:hypothetical protein